MSWIEILHYIFTAYQWLILIRVLLSWFPISMENLFFRVIYKLTEPVLAPFRQAIPSFWGIDFSPIFVFIVMDFLERILIQGVMSWLS